MTDTLTHTTFQCSQCPSTISIDVSIMGAYQAAHTAGWRNYRNEQMFCPTCWAIMKRGDQEMITHRGRFTSKAKQKRKPNLNGNRYQGETAD